ncbi:MAG: metallophosphoesterase [Anaerolineae bacterium]|nr:metallophosphoesterase [Anaerolineae bacterium]
MNRRWLTFLLPGLLAAVAAGCATPPLVGTLPQATPGPSACAEVSTRFAVIGDYGDASQPEADVAALVASWSPDFVVTAGDNNYPLGEARTIDANIGQFYHAFIAPYGGAYGLGSSENRFFPALGNHDWYSNAAAAYFDYFTLPGNERYYDLVRGPVHLFVLDSDSNEPDGIDVDSVQAAWLRDRLAASQTPWQIVLLHHPPYTSSERGPAGALRWPFAAWGADVVMAGHDHTYERLEVEGIPYLVNGLGGRSIYEFSTPVAESRLRFNGDYGALLAEAGADCLSLRFYTRTGAPVDELVLTGTSS